MYRFRNTDMCWLPPMIRNPRSLSPKFFNPKP